MELNFSIHAPGSSIATIYGLSEDAPPILFQYPRSWIVNCNHKFNKQKSDSIEYFSIHAPGSSIATVLTPGAGQDLELFQYPRSWFANEILLNPFAALRT